MKTIYSCIAAILIIITGGALFLPHLMKARPGAVAAPYGATAPSAIPEPRIPGAPDYGKLPLSFEANQGQTDSRVKFLSRGRGYSLFLTRDEAVLTFGRASQKANGKSQKAKIEEPGVEIRNSKSEIRNLTLAARPLSPATAAPAGVQTTDREPLTTDSVLRMKLVGANANATLTGAAPLPGKSNYFIGNDPRQWRTNVPTYAEVKYRNVYPGVDLVYYGNQGGQLEYDFVVAPGADPAAIRLALSGALQASSRQSAVSSSAHDQAQGRSKIQNLKSKIDDNGDLVVQTGGGEIRFHKPVVYQELESEDRGRESQGKDETGNWKLETGNSNPVNRPSTIENRQWYFNHQSPITNRKFLAGHYTLDAQNRVRFQIAAYDHSKPLLIDPVLSYSTYLGGSGYDESTSIAVDSSGNAYVTGYTCSANFPTEAPIQMDYAGGCTTGVGGDAFVAKLNAAGSALVYSTYLGGSGADAGSGIAVDSSGNAYVTGWTTSTNFPTVNPLQPAQNGRLNAFVAKLNPAGSALIYSTYLGGNHTDAGAAIAADSTGNAYVTGYTGSADFPTANPLQPASGGSFDAFVAKFNPTGSALVYSTYLGGNLQDYGQGIAVDSSGNVYVTGTTYSTNFPTMDPLQAQNNCTFGNAFVAKVNAAGSALVYSTYLGGSGSDMQGDEGFGIAVDSSGSAYVTGFTTSTDFPKANPLQPSCSGGGPNCNTAFVAKFNVPGSALVYSTYLGGSHYDYGSGIAVDSSGDAYVTGYTESTDFPTANPIQANCGGYPSYPEGCLDAFVTEFNVAGSALVYSTFLGGSKSDYGASIAVDTSDNAYVAGYTQSTDFPTASPLQASNNGGYDAFVAKIGLGGVPSASLSATNLTFASQPEGTTSAAQTVTVTNVGTGNLLIATALIGGTNATDFGTSDDTCSGATLTPAPGPASTCTVYVAFAPLATGPLAGVLTFTDNSGGTTGSQQTVMLSGAGTNAAATFSPVSLSFGLQVINTTSAVKMLTLTSSGTTDLMISGIALTGTNASDFSQTNTCTAPSYAPGAKCTISVTFTPSLPGQETANLMVTDNAANSPQMPALVGTGEHPAALFPTSLSFGNVVEGNTSAGKTITLLNNQSVALTSISVGIIGSTDYSQTNTCGTSIAAGQKCTITVTLTPSVVAPDDATLSVSDSGVNSPQTAPMTGVGTTPVTLTPASVTYASQKVGTTSPAKLFTLSSKLTAALNNIVISTSGKFAVSATTCGTSLAGKGNCTISVVFKPAATGITTGTLSVSDSAGNSPQSSQLTGTGK